MRNPLKRQKSEQPSKGGLRKQTIFNVVVIAAGIVTKLTGVEIPEEFIEPAVEIIVSAVALVNISLRKKDE